MVKDVAKKADDFSQWCLDADQKTLHNLLAFCLSTSINAVQTKQIVPTVSASRMLISLPNLSTST
jgi:hypothetical protein